MLILHERSGPRSVSDCSEFVLQILSQRPDAKEDNPEVFFSFFTPDIVCPAQLVLNTYLLMLTLEDLGQKAIPSFQFFCIFSTRNGVGVDITARNGVGVDISSTEWGMGGYIGKEWGRG